MQKFKPVNTRQYFLLPPSAEDFIKGDHLGRVVAEVADELDTTTIEKQYSYLGGFHCLVVATTLTIPKRQQEIKQRIHNPTHLNILICDQNWKKTMAIHTL